NFPRTALREAGRGGARPRQIFPNLFLAGSGDIKDLAAENICDVISRRCRFVVAGFARLLFRVLGAPPGDRIELVADDLPVIDKAVLVGLEQAAGGLGDRLAFVVSIVLVVGLARNAALMLVPAVVLVHAIEHAQQPVDRAQIAGGDLFRRQTK